MNRYVASAPLAAFALGAVFAVPSAVGPTGRTSADFHLQEATIDDIQSAIRAGTLTSTKLVGLYLARIQRYNGTCVSQPQGILGPIATKPHAGQLNALSTLNLRPAARRALGFDDRKARSLTDAADADPSMPDALETAAELDRKFAATHQLVGPLHGVVIAVKDQYDTRDMRTTAGADADYANDRPPRDATFVQRLRDAGAIIIAKSNMGEYASAVPRSSFGGVFCNPYDTERSPRGSSSGSGSAVAANLVTCAIAEETGSSIRGPASAGSEVGISGTEELVSRKGMVQQGINTRVGPICRTVQDAARILDVIAGYDPADELTAFAVGRMPEKPYASFAVAGRLDGLRIGVLREYMDTTLFQTGDEESVALVEAQLPELAKLGATIVDPGPRGALFTPCVRKYLPAEQNGLFTRRFKELFPVDAEGKPAGDHIATLIDLNADPSKVPAEISFYDMGGGGAAGEGAYWMDRYLRERGDAAVRTSADQATKARFFKDPNFPGGGRGAPDSNREYDLTDRMQFRFSVQQVILQCMAEQRLDAVVYPSANLPPMKLGAPPSKNVYGRDANERLWNFLPAQGFPALTVPIGFTTKVYDLVWKDGAPPARRANGYDAENTRLVGPTAAMLPAGMDILGRPFSEPTLIRIAAAYEAATHKRRPPSEFGPVPGEP